MPAYAGNKSVNVVNELTVPLGSTADVNVVNEPAVCAVRGEPFQARGYVILRSGKFYEHIDISIGDENRLEIEYVSIRRTAIGEGDTPSEKVSVRLKAVSGEGPSFDGMAGFVASDFRWAGNIGGEKVLLHVRPGGIIRVWVYRDNGSGLEDFEVFVVGHLFPVQ